MLKSTVFELEQWFLHQNGPFFHQEFNEKGLWVLHRKSILYEKMKNKSEFQNSCIQLLCVKMLLYNMYMYFIDFLVVL